VPTTHGTPSSRDTIAAWQVMPPPSVIRAAARRIAGTQSGLVIAATSTSPSCSRSCWSGEPSTRTGPLARPCEAFSPVSSTCGSAPLGVLVGRWPSVVIGRDCTMKVSPPAHAHSRSCGEP